MIAWVTNRLVLLGLCLALLAASAARAGPPPAFALPVTFVRQQTSMWCWLAVVEMAMLFKAGSSPPQCRMIEIAFDLNQNHCCRSRACAGRGGSLEDMQRLLSRLGRQARLTPPSNSARELYSLLTSRKVVIARLVPRQRGGIRIGGSGRGHTVVLRGMRFTPFRQAGRVITLPIVLINDPQYPGPIEVPYPDVAATWRRSLIVD